MFSREIIMKLSAKLTSALFVASAVFTTVTLAPVLAQEAAAQTVSAKSIVDKAKTDRIVGEKLNGYLALVTQDVSPEIRAAVNEINIKRKSIYTRLARGQNVGVSDIAGLTGEKLVAKAKLGEMVMLADNQWRPVEP
jgi:uncharacterized protein